MIKFNIEGMKCSSCIAKINKALNDAGYVDSNVTLSPPHVKFAKSSITREELQRIISTAGEYKVSNADKASTEPAVKTSSDSSDEKLTPLFIILSYITGGVLLRAWIADDYSFATLMSNFMGAFFVVFSLFKLLNLEGFAEAYATYDIIGSKNRSYSLAYPFIELLLGVSYLTGFQPFLTNFTTLILMIIGSIGVLKALRSKRKFQCACLGTVLKLPMTKVTLVEDVTMGLMALIMIFYQGH